MKSIIKYIRYKRDRAKAFMERVRCLYLNIKLLSKPSYPTKILLRDMCEKDRVIIGRIDSLQYELNKLYCIEEKLAAMQALDISFRHTGKLVILSRVGKRDVCKILDIKPQMTWVELRRLTDAIQVEYGVSVGYVDSPEGLSAEDFLKMTRYER